MIKCQIIGDPVRHSLSPYLHNAVYKKLGIDDQYVFDAVQVSPPELGRYLERARGGVVRGISVTVPHKVGVMQYLDEIGEFSGQIGAVNTIVNENGKLSGHNTDTKGVLFPLNKRLGSVKGKTVLVLGAGGAARAAAFVLKKEGATVHVANRTPSRAEALAKDSGAILHALDEIDSLEFDILFNATTVGLKDDRSLVPASVLKPEHIVFDAVYKSNPKEVTTLLKDAERVGATTIDGLEMLAYQAIRQIKRYTGRDIDGEAVLEILKARV